MLKVLSQQCAEAFLSVMGGSVRSDEIRFLSQPTVDIRATMHQCPLVGIPSKRRLGDSGKELRETVYGFYGQLSHDRVSNSNLPPAYHGSDAVPKILILVSLAVPLHYPSVA